MLRTLVVTFAERLPRATFAVMALGLLFAMAGPKTVTDLGAAAQSAPAASAGTGQTVCVGSFAQWLSCDFSYPDGTSITVVYNARPLAAV